MVESLNDQLLEASTPEAVGSFSDAIMQYIQPRSLLTGFVEYSLPQIQSDSSEAHRLAAAVCLGSVLRHMESGGIQTHS